jgi:hypothetical protein
MCTVKRILFI